MKKHIILFNGPPLSGKDTGALFLHNNVISKFLRFAQPIKDVSRTIYDLSAEQFDYFEIPKNKDVSSDIFFGKSWRQVQIDIGETLKEKNDKTFWCRLVERKIVESGYDKIIIPDCGFYHELSIFGEKPDKYDVTLFRISRIGHTYKNDSRHFVDGEFDNTLIFDIENNNNIAQYNKKILKHFNLAEKLHHDRYEQKSTFTK